MEAPSIGTFGVECASCLGCFSCGACQATLLFLIGAAGLLNSSTLGSW